MICRGCKRQVSRREAFCGVCGRPVRGDGDAGALELVLPDGARVGLSGVMTIGRGEDNTVRLDDRSVSRRHARVTAGAGVPLVEDVGSSFGTKLDGRAIAGPAALSDGARLTLGDVELRVERPRAAEEAGRTLMVPVGGTVMVSTAGAAGLDTPGTQFGFRPRVRSGYTLKRLEDEGDSRRVVLRNERTGDVLRMGEDEAELFAMLDGTLALPDLMAAAENTFGLAGMARLTRLLSELGERGFLADVDAREQASKKDSLLSRLSRPREKIFPGAGRLFERLYVGGGYLFFTRAGIVAFAAIGLGGLAAFVGLIAGRYGTPFVVASKVGLGGLAFLLGRFLVVAIHELAHGLAMASFGRKPSHAGVKLVFLFPFAFVDTSDSWFEPKRRRLAISGAGPVSDFVVGGIFSLVALVLSAGTLRDIFFQVAFAAYVGAFFNLNPLLDRDGYHMLVDWLHQPGLRPRAREHIMRKLAGKPVRSDAPRSLTIYGALTLAWLVAAIAFVVIMTLVFYDRLVTIAPPEVVWSVLGAFYLLLFVPVVLVFGRPAWERIRTRREGMPRAA